MKFVFILGLVAFVCGIPHKQEQPVAKQGYNYGEVLGLSIMFYEAQRTGKLPANNRIPYRGDSMLNDKGSDGEDLTGGYFDAGDHVKFGFPMAAFTTIVAWGLIDYEGGYSGSGNLDAGRDVVRWSAEYFIKAHPQQYKLYVQVGDGNADHAFWGRPEEWNGPRPSYFIDTNRPGSDIAAETAAALAASYLVFKDSDPSFASTCLAHARDLMAFADTYRAKYSDSVPEAAQFYNSWSGFGDELAWGAAWMYRATGEQKYLDDVRRFQSEYDQVNGRPAQFGWDDKTAGFQILMAKLTNEDQYKTKAAAFCDWVVDQAPKTPKGLVHLDQWGALRHASNVAFVCMQAGDVGINRDKYYDFARRQIGYILGDSGRSFVCGYGNNPPTKPHHRSSSCPSLPAACDWNSGAENPGPNHQTLYGALVGGPDAQDNYVDDRNDYVKNEVATDYNAAFQSALAALAQAQSKGML